MSYASEQAVSRTKLEECQDFLKRHDQLMAMDQCGRPLGLKELRSTYNYYTRALETLCNNSKPITETIYPFDASKSAKELLEPFRRSVAHEVSLITAEMTRNRQQHFPTLKLVKS